MLYFLSFVSILLELHFRYSLLLSDTPDRYHPIPSSHQHKRQTVAPHLAIWGNESTQRLADRNLTGSFPYRHRRIYECTVFFTVYQPVFIKPTIGFYELYETRVGNISQFSDKLLR
ncbi:hypothetical protein C8Q75DRAFT_479524 [Abortiporus biennis]|nr:hypothetical protein C8Q75DRAFT_479524 [Abortiporus biennis]